MKRSKVESRGLGRRKGSYPQTKSAAVRTGGRQSWRASVDDGPAEVGNCARSEVMVGVQGGNNESGDD